MKEEEEDKIYGKWGMKRLRNKKIISISIIMILAMTAIPTTAALYTGCLSLLNTKTDLATFLARGMFYNFDSGDTPISPCNTGDYQLSIYDKNYIDGTINYLQNAINSLTDRISNLENNPYPATYYQTWNGTSITQINTWTQISTMTINLPKPAYVYIESSGTMYGWNYWAGINTIVDGVAVENYWYGDDAVSNGWTGFVQPAIQYLPAGTHTITINGLVYGIGYQGTWATAKIAVTASEKGSIQSGNTARSRTISAPPIPKTTPTKK